MKQRRRCERLATWALAASLLACADEAESKDGSGSRVATDPAGGAAADAGVAASGSTLEAETELCGGLGEPCCSLPLPPCAHGALCDAAGDVCAPGPSRARLCRSGSDCASNETCCPSGAFGSCVALSPRQVCPVPDLAVGIVASNGPFGFATYETSRTDCERGCYVGLGTRRVLAFQARVFNLGEADAVLGAPSAPGIRAECGAYLEGALYFELHDASGMLVRSVDARFQPGCGFDRHLGKFSCELLGIEPGYYEDFATRCNGLDVSGVPAGDYTLSVRLDLDPAVFADADPINNLYQLPVNLPSTDPTQSCPEEANSLLGSDELRECGWTATTAACAPGELLSLGCPGCDGSPMLRLCDGPSPCAYASPDLLHFSNQFEPGCPLLTLLCPESAAYTAMTASLEPHQSFSCNPQPVAVSRDPLAACTAGESAINDVARECEWSVAATANCTPGDALVVGCPDCEGDPMLRVCDGNAPCLASSSAELGAFDDSTDRGVHAVCPLVPFTCPLSGNYAVLAAPVYAGSPYACTPSPLLLSVDAAAPCSDRLAPGWGTERQCDWVLASSGSCASGQTVALGCDSCGGAPALRVCDGSGVCAPGAAAELAAARGSPTTCPSVSFSCPASGMYSAWVAAAEPNQQYDCTAAP